MLDPWIPSGKPDLKRAEPVFDIKDAENVDMLDEWISSRTSKDSAIMLTKDFQDRVFKKYASLTQMEAESGRNPREIAEYLQTCPTLKGVLFRNADRLLDIWWEWLLWRSFEPGMRAADEELRQKWHKDSKRILSVFNVEKQFMKLHLPPAVAWRIYETFEGVYGKGPDCWSRTRMLAKFISCDKHAYWKDVGDRLKVYPQAGCHDDFRFGPQIRNFRMAMRRSSLVKSLLAFSIALLLYASYCTAMLAMSSLEFPWLPRPTPSPAPTERIIPTDEPTPTLTPIPHTEPPALPTSSATPSTPPNTLEPAEGEGKAEPESLPADAEDGATKAPASANPKPESAE
jgi:hypothetical protein